MDFKKAMQKIMDDVEKTLDKITGENAESRAVEKKKIKKFFSDLLKNKAKNGNDKDEKDC